MTTQLRSAPRPTSVPAPRFPFGGVHLDLTRLADPPLHALPLPQQRLEDVLAERAGELGVEIRRGHQVTGVVQDEAAVTAEVLGPDGPYRVTARYLAGCDGARNRLRDGARIAWAVAVDESPEDAVPALREALTRWFGEPESDV